MEISAVLAQEKKVRGVLVLNPLSWAESACGLAGR
jgi:hypothetical protein